MTEESDIDAVVAEEVDQDGNKPFNVQFRISGEQAKVVTRLAKMLHENKIIKYNSIHSLMKACAFTQINLYLNMEARELAYQQREKELELERIELEKKGVVKYNGPSIPNFGSY